MRIELLPGLPRRFNATLALDGLPFSQSSAIFLEAMCAGSPVIERFPCGEVGHPRMLREQPLGEIEGKNVFFTLKVVDRSERGTMDMVVAVFLRRGVSDGEWSTGH